MSSTRFCDVAESGRPIFKEAHAYRGQKPNLDDGMPLRLINLSPESSSCEMQIVLSEDTGCFQYVALSCPWGDLSAFMLTNDNYDERQRGIHESELPHTLRDASYLTRNLG